MAQWQPIIAWMTPLLNPVQAANDPSPVSRVVTRPTRAAGLGSSRPNSLMPAQDSLVHGGRLSAFAAATRPAAVPAQPVNKPSLPRSANPGESSIPQFLKRGT